MLLTVLAVACVAAVIEAMPASMDSGAGTLSRGDTLAAPCGRKRVPLLFRPGMPLGQLIPDACLSSQMEELQYL